MVKKEIRKNFRGAGKVAFLARKDGIQKMFNEGYPMLLIYEKYSAELNISYSQFIRYIQRYFRSAPHGNERKSSSDKPPSENVEPKTGESDFAKGFNAGLEEEDETNDPAKQFERDAEEGDFF